MPSLPPQHNRVLLAADALKDEIQNGRLSEVLPGERELAKRLQISRNTLRKAIEQLEKEAWISRAEHGRRRQILSTPPFGTQLNIAANSLKGSNVVTMAPLPLDHMGGAERLLQSRLSSYCSKIGVTPMHRALDIRHIERPAFRLSQFVQQNPADLYLLQHSSLPIQKWFKEQHIPCIVLGSTWIDINLPCVDIDQAAVGVHATSVIQRLGHTQIGLIHPVPEKRGIQILTDTLKLNLADSNIHMAGHQDTPESIARAVTQLLNKTKDTPTILLSPTPYAMITAFTTAVNMGYRVPENLSLLCLSYDKVLSYLNPTVAGYHVPIDDYPKAVFKSIVDYLKHPNSQSGSQRLITPDFVKGGSLSQTG